jgi:zinc protease
MLTAHLDRPLDILAEMMRNASFPETEFALIRKGRLSALANQGLTAPAALSLAFGPVLYGEDHPYGIATTIGTKASLEAMTRDDLQRFVQSWLRPDRATILLAGDITKERATSLLEERFGRWEKPTTKAPDLTKVNPRALPEKPRVILIDIPRSSQTTIQAAQLVPPDNGASDTERSIFNTIFGGYFGSRLNLHIRETKGWSYGVVSTFTSMRSQRSWLINAPVEKDHTADTIVELQREMKELLSTRPITEEEVESRRDHTLATLATLYETNGALYNQLVGDYLLGHPLDYPLHTVERLKAIDAAVANRTAQDLLRPDQLTWLIAGDLATIRPQIEKLNLGTIELWSRDGHPIPAAPAGDTKTAPATPTNAPQ